MINRSQGEPFLIWQRMGILSWDLGGFFQGSFFKMGSQREAEGLKASSINSTRRTWRCGHCYPGIHRKNLQRSGCVSCGLISPQFQPRIQSSSSSVVSYRERFWSPVTLNVLLTTRPVPLVLMATRWASKMILCVQCIYRGVVFSDLEGKGRQILKTI